MLRLRSHIVAKAAIERPFTRSSDWSCMSVTKQGPNYLTPVVQRQETSRLEREQCQFESDPAHQTMEFHCNSMSV